VLSCCISNPPVLMSPVQITEAVSIPAMYFRLSDSSYWLLLSFQMLPPSHRTSTCLNFLLSPFSRLWSFFGLPLLLFLFIFGRWIVSVPVESSMLTAISAQILHLLSVDLPEEVNFFELFICSFIEPCSDLRQIGHLSATLPEPCPPLPCL
jgi:hypothetical protein